MDLRGPHRRTDLGPLCLGSVLGLGPPKEVWAFITWVAYAAYLHARATAGWRGKRAAILALIGFSALLFNFVGINIFGSGLHSYAGK